ncbi:MAG: hypothetical protein DMF25_02440 [Verrucomicrobia bacterium]|nr:MAG: hypothetical protein DMF25_02440 [Verrucomicrobiota bacterium]
MEAAARVLLSTCVLLWGCRATRDVAVTSYHVATAPVRLVHRAISADSPPPSSTTTTTTSDVTTPGRPVPVTSPSSSQQQRIASRTSATETPSGNAPTKSKGSPPQTTAVQPQFPTARPVPGRPGIVFNPYDPGGGYIDVSGYAPGSKVKDPDSQKIFIVP